MSRLSNTYNVLSNICKHTCLITNRDQSHYRDDQYSYVKCQQTTRTFECARCNQNPPNDITADIPVHASLDPRISLSADDITADIPVHASLEPRI